MWGDLLVSETQPLEKGQFKLKYETGQSDGELHDVFESNTNVLVAAPLPQEGLIPICCSLQRPEVLVTKLVLSHLKMGMAMAKFLGKSLESNRTIQCLHLDGNVIGPDGAEYIANALCHNNIVSELILSRNDLGPQGGHLLGKMMMVNRSITVLDVSNNFLSNRGVIGMASCLYGNTTLTHLNISTNHGRVGGAKAIAKALRTNQTLRTLLMADNHAGSAGASALGQALKENRSVTMLDMSNNDVLSESLNHMMEALKSNHVLTDLRLGRNIITSRGMIGFKDVLIQNTTLKTLTLEYNKIDQDGAVMLGDILRVNQTLTHLDVSSNELTDEGGRLIGEALRVNAGLKKLHIRFNKLGLSSYHAFADSLTRNNNTLTHLDLERMKIEPSYVTAMANMIKWNKGLRYLSLGCWNMDFIQMDEFIDALKFNHTLQSLYVPNALFGAACIKLFEEVLREHNGSLETYGPNVYTPLLDYLKRNKTLHESVLQCVLILLASRRFRRSMLNLMPKEIVAIMGQDLWNTRADFKGWLTK